jgi:tetratricopeptide (TPR) repeat protein
MSSFVGSDGISLDEFGAALERDPCDEQSLLAMARRLYDEKKFQDAQTAFGELVRLHSSFAPAWLGLALIARESGDHQRALELARTASSHNPVDPWISHLIGLELRDLGLHGDAEATFQALVDQSQGFAYGWRELGLSARHRGDGASALQCFRRASECDPGNGQLLQDVSDELRRTGLESESDAILAKLMKEHPHFAPPWRDAAMAARKRGWHQQALDLFRGALQGDPCEPWTHLNVSVELRELGRWDEAEATLRALVEAKPDFGYGWQNLGFCARHSGDGALALEAFRRAIACEPDNIQFQFDLAAESRTAGEGAEAERLLTAIIDGNPNFATAWRELAMIARSNGQNDRGLDFFRVAHKCEPSEPWTLFDIGSELRALGRTDEAEATFWLLIDSNPSFAYGWRGLALCALDRGDLAKALEYLVPAVKYDSGNLWHYDAFIDHLRALKDNEAVEQFTESLLLEYPLSARACQMRVNALRKNAPRSMLIELLEKAVALEPDDLTAKLSLADELRYGWRLDEAQKLYAAIVEAQPENAFALFGQAMIARSNADRASARALLEKAAKADKRNRWVAIELARESMEAGALERAIGDLRDWLACRGDCSEAQFFLAELQRMRGDYSEALFTLRRAVELQPNSVRTQKTLAAEEFRQGQVQTAKRRLEVSLSQNPDDPVILEAIGDLCNLGDDLENAIEFFNRASGGEAPEFWLALKMVSVLTRLGERDRADAILQAEERKSGFVPEIIIARAEMLREREGGQAAADLLEQGVDAYPAHFELWFQYNMALIALGRFERADKAASAPPFPLGAREQARTHFLRGLSEAARWHFDVAVQNFSKALDFNPRDSWVNEWMARAALLRADVETAQKHLAAARLHDANHLAKNRGLAKPSQSLIGQLLDEYRIDARALDAMRGALNGDLDSPGIAELVREFPDYTPMAMSYLLALRRKGAFAPRDDVIDANGAIPRQIAQFWDMDMPADLEMLCDSWRRTNPEFGYQRFSTQSARQFLLGRAQQVATAFDRAREPAMKSDLFRLAFLYFEGGYYADADDRCLRPLAELGGDRFSLMSYQEDYATIGNNFLCAAPKHPVIGMAMKQAVEAVRRGDNDMVWLATGPGLITRCLALFIAQDEDARLRDLKIFDRHELSERITMHCAASYKFKGKHWIKMPF